MRHLCHNLNYYYHHYCLGVAECTAVGDAAALAASDAAFAAFAAIGAVVVVVAAAVAFVAEAE